MVRETWQRSHVNTACKLLLLRHAFDEIGCKVVGFRTDNFNFASQRAVEALEPSETARSVTTKLAKMARSATS